MRQLLVSQLLANAALVGYIGDRLYAAGTLGTGDIPAAPDKPYAQYMFEEAVPYAAVRKTSRAMNQPVVITVYDYRGESYTQIYAIHRLIRDTVEGLAGRVSPSGRRCTDAALTSLGRDDSDARLDANFKRATYRITGPQ
jgi:hypothetical protein